MSHFDQFEHLEYKDLNLHVLEDSIHPMLFLSLKLSSLGSKLLLFFSLSLPQLQFFMGLVYASQSIYIECEYPVWMEWTGIVYGITIIALFLNFYVQAYIKPKPSGKTHDALKVIMPVIIQIILKLTYFLQLLPSSPPSSVWLVVCPVVCIAVSIGFLESMP